MTTFNRDAMMGAPVVPVARTAMALLNALQDCPQFAQVLGAAVVFLALSAEYDIDPQDAFTATKNMIAAETENRPEFRAVAQYIREELVNA